MRLTKPNVSASAALPRSKRKRKAVGLTVDAPTADEGTTFSLTARVCTVCRNVWDPTRDRETLHDDIPVTLSRERPERIATALERFLETELGRQATPAEVRLLEAVRDEAVPAEQLYTVLLLVLQRRLTSEQAVDALDDNRRLQASARAKTAQ